MEYAARYVFIRPSSAEVLGARLKEQNVSSDLIEGSLNRLPDQLQAATASEFYDEVVVADSLEAAYEALRGFIYGTMANGTATNGEKAAEANEGDNDEPMLEVAGSADAAESGVNGSSGIEA
jgi:THO complex subunit 1